MENTELVERAVRYIDRGSNAVGLSIDEVARNAGFSVDYFNRIFRNHTGFNVMEYIRFRNLTRAALRLRKTEEDILSVALDSGYDSHDGFTRAFKSHYGKTPSEYREMNRNVPVVFGDLGLNATAERRFLAELSEFRVVDPDDAIDCLLETDPHRFGYEAITIHFNGSKVFVDRELSSGIMVMADMFYSDGAVITLKMPDLTELADYVTRLMVLKPSCIRVICERDVEKDEIRNSLGDIRYDSICIHPNAMYFGEPYAISEDGYTIRFLEPGDKSQVDEWISKKGWQTDFMGIKRSLESSREKHPDNQIIGMFDKDNLVGVASICIQEAHGFRLNNCAAIVLLSEYNKQEHFKRMFKFSVNEAMKQGAIPFEDTQFGEYAETHGGFEATDMGFKLVGKTYTIEFKH